MTEQPTPEHTHRWVDEEGWPQQQCHCGLPFTLYITELESALKETRQADQTPEHTHRMGWNEFVRKFVCISRLSCEFTQTPEAVMAALEKARRESAEHESWRIHWLKRKREERRRAVAAEGEVERLRTALQGIAMGLPMNHQQECIISARAALAGAPSKFKCVICNDTGKLDDAQAWDEGQEPSDCPYCEAGTPSPTEVGE